MGALKIVMDNNELKEPKFNYKSELLKLVPNEDIVNDYIAVGKTMKRTPTKTGLNLFVKECEKYNLSYELAMTIVIDKNWRGFNYLWLKDEDFEKYGLRKKQQVKQKEKPITMEEAKNIISEQEKIFRDKQRINEAFIEYMDTFETPDFPTIKFNSLVEYGLISIDEKTANYYAKKSKQAIEILKEKHKPENATTRNERNAKVVLMKLIEEGVAPEIEVKVKELVLLEFFDAKIKEGKNVIFEL